MAGSKEDNPHGVGVEPIAIIGAACRFSGTASSQDGLWQMLCKGRTGWASSARNRFNLDAFWHPHAQLSGSFNNRGLHLLQQDPAVFDNDFFGISGVEAKAIDPQQRMMLEIAYETFENAGIPLDKLEGSNTGVYCALPYVDYDQMQARDPEASPLYRNTGTGPPMVANRISYIFNLHGPSIAIDTACSSSLVAIHEACRALRVGDIDQVLVGGANLILDPEKIAVISSMQFLSPHGRCYAFDSRASGYGRGEGVAAILLKPLEAAIRDGDTIRGVIRGTAIGSDGKTNGITRPSPDAQYDTIQRAYKAAGLDPRETLYVEAHGTGTSAGDSCEINAFAKAFCQQRRNKLIVGSVKANLGHTESISGLAGVLKVLLTLEQGEISPTPTFASPNPQLELEAQGIQVLTKSMKWPDGVARRASINGSGYGGMNGHVIIEAWSGTYRESRSEPSRHGETKGLVANDHDGTSTLGEASSGNPVPAAMNGVTINGHAGAGSKIFVWSHQRQDGLAGLASTWKRFLMGVHFGQKELSLDSLAFTLCSRRTRFAYRAAIVASGIQELLEGIASIESGSKRPAKAMTNPRLCFVFTGQGAQWACMGLELFSRYPVFSQSIQRAEGDILKLGATWNLIEELQKPQDVSRINDAELAQPCCTAIQIALVDLLESWNIRPDSTCGHSSGEIAAAYAAGALAASDAIKVAYFRGQAVSRLKETAPSRSGGMLAVGLSELDVRKFLTNHKDTITIACINSPSSVTLSGDADAIDELTEVFESAKIFNRKLLVGVAYHSHHMAAIDQYYRSTIAGVEPRELKRQVRMVSSVTVQDVQGQELGADYWARNLISPVRFSDALVKVLRPEEGDNSPVPPGLVVEVGPHFALKGPVTQVLSSFTALHSVSYLACLSRNEDSIQSCLSLASELFSRGVPIDLSSVNNLGDENANVLTNLPVYNWHHAKAHWNESRRSAAYRLRKSPRHDLLGTASADSISAEPSWHHYIRPSEMPWVKGHRIDGQTVFAAAGYISMVIEALKDTTVTLGWKNKVVQFKEVVIDRPLLLQDDASGAEVFTLLRPYSYSSRASSSRWHEFRIFSVSNENESTEHCRGLVALIEMHDQVAMNRSQINGEMPNHVNDNLNNKDDDVDTWTHLEARTIYRELRALGVDYTGCFASLETMLARPWESKCSFLVPDVKSTMPSEHQQPHCLHPTTLEGCFQACLPGLKLAGSLNQPQVISSIEELCVSTNVSLKPGDTMSITTKSMPYGLRQFSADVSATSLDGSNSDLIRVKGVKFMSSQGSADGARTREESLCHRIEWLLDPFGSSSESVITHCKSGLITRHQGLRRSCDPFCRRLIHETLAQLRPDDEAAIPGHLRLFLKWMRSKDVFDAQSADSDGHGEEMMKAIGAPGEMLIELGHRLRDILRGNEDSLSSIFNNENLYRLYSEDSCLNRCYAQLAEYLKLVQFKVPDLRVLEIGGGAGSLTCTLVEALYGSRRGYPPTSKSYVFTDVSTSFIDIAQGKLGKFESFMEFRQFDIEQAADEQGLALGSFDVIVASNALHVTQNLGAALSNLRSLLKPGGQLAFIELTEPSLRWGIFGGGLPGSWLGAGEGCTNAPLLRTPQWNEVLTMNGFSGVSLEMKDHDVDEEHEASLMISHTISTEAPPRAEQIVIVTADSDNNTYRELYDGLLANFPEADVVITGLSQAPKARGTYIFLLEISADFLLAPSECNWINVRDLLCEAEAVLWVTKNSVLPNSEPRSALITGLARSLRAENHDINIFTLDLEDSPDVKASPYILQVYKKFIAHTASPYAAAEWELAVRDGCIIIPRLFPDEVVNSWVQDTVSRYHPREENFIESNRALSLRIHSVGMLDTLYWADHPIHSQPPKPTQVKVRLENISINFKDLMIAMGQLDGLSALLIEGSGTVIEVGDAAQSRFSIGDKVCCLEVNGLATVSNIDMHHACIIPQGMSMETAAAIPVAYGTSLFALRDVARLRPGESVLIHSGAGALGQAAIAVAKSLGAKDIFVTAGSQERCDFIRDRCGIKSDHILLNRTLDFGERILQLTGGAGVDVILNSLSGEGLATSCSAIASFGRFVEIGKRDFLTNGKLEMKHLTRNVSFSAVDLSIVAEEKPEVLIELIQTSIRLVHSKALDLIEPLTTKHISETEKLLRTMQAGKHTGKLILRLDTSLPLKVQPPPPKIATLRNDSSYLVVGGTGGLGRPIMRYLAKLGARRIITLSRSGSNAADMARFVQEMKHLGVELVIIQGSVCEKQSLDHLRAISREMPIRGVIQGATTLEQSVVRSMTHTQWINGIGPKAVGTLNLQAELGENLDFFILLSSIAGVIGTLGQGNYCAGNTLQDAFAQYQASRGRPARSIDVGAVHSEGMAAQNDDFLSSITSQGLIPHSVEELLAVINYAIQNPIAATPAHAQILCGARRADQHSGTEEAARQRSDARFSHIYSRAPARVNRLPTDDDFDVVTALQAASTAPMAIEAAYTALKQKLARLLAISVDEVQPNRSIASYGVDSLISVELRNWLSGHLGSKVQMLELTSPMAISQLAEVVARRSHLVPVSIFSVQEQM